RRTCEHPGIVGRAFCVRCGLLEFGDPGRVNARRGRRTLREREPSAKEQSKNKPKHEPVSHQSLTPGREDRTTPKSTRSPRSLGNRNYLWRESGIVMSARRGVGVPLVE